MPIKSGTHRVPHPLVHLNAMISPQHLEWLREQANQHSERLDADISVSKIIRACIRYTNQSLKNWTIKPSDLDPHLQ